MGKKIKMIVNEKDIETFQKDGAICLRGLFSQEWVERMQASVEKELEFLRQQEGSPRLDILHHLSEKDAEIADFIKNSPAQKIAQEMMRSQNAVFYFDQTFVKEPGTSAPTPWHQDQPYWAISGGQVCSIWLALDVVTKESSGLEYVGGSHDWGKTYGPVPFSKGSEEKYSGGVKGDVVPDIDARREDYRLLSWDMQPGDCLIHQGYTLHGASFNSTRTQRRRALSTRWFGDNACYAAPQSYMDEGTFDPALKEGDSMLSSHFATSK